MFFYVWHLIKDCFLLLLLIKEHLDPRPRMTFRGHFKVTNVKIANIFLMVQDKHVVTMKHCWEVDIGLSDPQKNLTLDDIEEVISRSRK